MEASTDPLLALASSVFVDPSKDNQRHLQNLCSGDFKSILSSPFAQQLTGRHNPSPPISSNGQWSQWLASKAASMIEGNARDGQTAVIVGLAALSSFVQANVTGPPLPFSPSHLIIPDTISNGTKAGLASCRAGVFVNLKVDGEAPYRLAPYPELLALARAVFECRLLYLDDCPVASWAKMRAWITHQRLLGGKVPSLEKDLEDLILRLDQFMTGDIHRDIKTGYLLEKAAILGYYGHGQRSRAALAEATAARQFEFVVTGRLGKRTKYQQNDISQLVVLAASSKEPEQETSSDPSGPVSLPLDDDTLLPRISFTPLDEKVKIQDDVPESLAGLDANNQPALNAQDAVILLSIASLISSSTPSLARDELTREEIGPFVTRVLDSGRDSTSGAGTNLNWQIYTHALLVRSRIEGFRTRTLERGLLQMVALRDQVVQDTTSLADSTTAPKDDTDSVPQITLTNLEIDDEPKSAGPTTSFLPAAKSDESAPANHRLEYVFALGCPYVWDIEAELAELWVQVGGLRSALEIYQRLEMWAEAALCWAGTEKEGRARAVIRRQLFTRTDDSQESADDKDDLEERGENGWKDWQGPERDPLPAEAPRLFCILADIEDAPELYERAWEVSEHRYARAQKSLGQRYYRRKQFDLASEAFRKAVTTKSLDGQVWFFYGCCLMRQEIWSQAVRALTRTVQINEEDADGWVNLAAALISLGEQEAKGAPEDPEPRERSDDKNGLDDSDDENDGSTGRTLPNRKLSALQALKHAARLRREDFRIWDNIITVASGLDPRPYHEIITAFRQLIALRGPVVGEKAIDSDIFGLLVRHITTTVDQPGEQDDTNDLSGEARMLVECIDSAVIPLITSNPDLWKSVARLELWRRRHSAVLEAHEKAWRCLTSATEWESSVSDESKKGWERIVSETLDLVDAYECFGSMETDAGEVMVPDWRFKARSAVRSVLSRARDGWEDSEGWESLQTALKALRKS